MEAIFQGLDCEDPEERQEYIPFFVLELKAFQSNSSNLEFF
jgi:hypothetical protein